MVIFANIAAVSKLLTVCVTSFHDTEDAQTRCAAVSATMKLCAQMGACSSTVTAMVNKYSKSSNIDATAL